MTVGAVWDVLLQSATHLQTFLPAQQSDKVQKQAIGGRIGTAWDKRRDTIQLLKLAVTFSGFQAFIWR